MKQIFYLLFGVFFLFSCQNNNANQKNGEESPVKVIEVLHTTNYTYLLVEDKKDQKWIAVPKMDAAVGDEYYIKEGMLMTDFNSKELNRTFDQIWFLGGVSTTPHSQQQGASADPHAGHDHHNNPHQHGSATGTTTGKVTTEKQEINIETASGGVTIKELFTNKEKYANKKVTVKGKVTKFSEQIMGRNWIHIQDGTDAAGEYDLTITSQEKVTVGEIVTLEGTVTLDKDFGYGYFYKVIIEEAKVAK
jgi:hypothetical protein